MKFLNEDEIVANGSGVYRRLRRDALDILGSALDAVDPKKAILSKVSRVGDELRVVGEAYDLRRFRRVFVIGGGKASGSMVEAVESLLSDQIVGGTVNLLKGTEGKYRVKHVRLVGASHPVPDEAGVRGVRDMLKMVSGLTRDDLVVVVISGGGSAIMPCPAKDITLNDLKTITSRLLKRGATINDLNAVRKHLDAFKGGQLSKRCHPATVLSLILSDVVGDPLDTIASGPTAPDSSTWKDAADVLRKYGVWDEAPPSIKTMIEDGLQGRIPDTPKESDPAFKNTRNVLVANNSYAAESAAKCASELGYLPMVLSTMVEGEARVVGSVYAGISREIVSKGRPLNSPAALLIGGETTVDVKGSGKGGRNQEVALGAVKKISGLPCLVASLATDGLDGPTDSAGAIIDGSTYDSVIAEKLSIDEALGNNDSYPLLKRLGSLLITGPTGTNVNDLALILVAGE